MAAMNLDRIQSALRERNFDAWLFYDHHHRDPIAYRVLGLRPELMVTRRWFYLVPANGEPQKLVHRIEAGHLDTDHAMGRRQEMMAIFQMQPTRAVQPHHWRPLAGFHTADPKPVDVDVLLREVDHRHGRDEAIL